MKVFTVHAPPGDIVSQSDRVRFVRDGFHIWAFVFGPFWMLVHRLWLVLIGYLVLLGAIEPALYAAGVDASASVWIWLLLAILVGLEAGTLRRWTLARRGFHQIGSVVARDLEAAEHRFFSHAGAASGLARATSFSGPVSGFAAPAPDILGSFPRPEGAPL